MKKRKKTSTFGSKNGSSPVGLPLRYEPFLTSDPREASWLALQAAFSGKDFASHWLEKWNNEASPSGVNFRLAQELTYGCLRLALSLDYIAEQLTPQKKLSLKLKERILVRMGIYQCVFMTKVPAYAALNETVGLSGKFCHKTFTAFLNAILRKLLQKIPPLPEGDSPKELSLRFSYPEFFVKKILGICSLEKAKEIFYVGNNPGLLMSRIRSGDNFDKNKFPYIQVFSEDPLMGLLKDSSQLSSMTQSPEFYIQNITPAYLLNELSKQWNKPAPETILDLCSSPGGKLIAIHDQYPSATLYSNDVSQEKVDILTQNLQKYSVPAKISCGKGEDYPSKELFDIVIIDAPCSNSGVLNKRAEARWRLTEKKLDELQCTQKNLLVHAITLLKPEGEIWFMTCSILPEENEGLIKSLHKKLGLNIKWQKSIQPNREGWDGGFACALGTVK